MLHYRNAAHLFYISVLVFFISLGGQQTVFAQEGDEPPYIPGMILKKLDAVQTTPQTVLQPVAIPPTTMTISPAAQISYAPLQLTMKPESAGTIRYTTNGAWPDATSQAYSGPIAINETTIIRAQLFDAAGNPVGNAETRSYIFPNYEQTIPVISLVSDWSYFDSIHTYARERGPEWERPVNVEYFEPGGELGFNIAAGVRIHGGFSRLYNVKKSYRLYFGNDYAGRLNYPVFEDTPVTEFDKLVLRAGFQDAFTHINIPERPNTHETAKYIGDQVVRNLHRDMGQPIAHGEWAVLYLNGEYWGLYNLTERIDAQFLQSYSAPDSGWDVVVKENGWDDEGKWFSHEVTRDGDYGAWLENQDWIGTTNFTQPENIGVLKARVDMENAFSYLFLQAYVQNYDWPGANWIAYRRNDPAAMGNETQWRMMVWDAEYSFGGGGEGFKTDKNTLVRAYSPHDSITRILEKPFIGNCAFKHEFVNRAREYLGVENLQNKPPEQVGQLSKERVKAELQKQADIVRPFIQMEAERWAPYMSVANFDLNIARSMQFVDEREDVILHHLDILRYQEFTTCQ